MNVITRFAPSPTGSLHIGGIRTAIFNWLYAKHNNGVFLLRIEDTDRERSTQDSVVEILEGLKWIGLEWDAEPFKQSTRLEIYKEIAENLVENDYAYRCYCTAEEIEERRKEYRKKGLIYRYERTCIDKKYLEDKPYAIRIKVPDSKFIEFTDLLRGKISYDCKEIDDFVILKRDGFPTYNFAVVIDDNKMEITDIIRGDDHLSNTPKQVLLYDLLKYTPPKFAHVSMILGQDKAKLSKRHGATSVLNYKENGYLPSAMLNFLVRLGWSHGDQEIFSKNELIELFNLKSLGKTPSIFNQEKLLWLNSYYIKNLPLDYISNYAKSFYSDNNIDTDSIGQEKYEKIIEILRERVQTVNEFPVKSIYFFRDIENYEEKAEKKFFNLESLPIIESVLDRLSRIEDLNQENINKVFKDIMQELDLKMGDIAQPVRVALTGGTASPGIFEVIDALGKKTTINRLKQAINYIRNKK